MTGERGAGDGTAATPHEAPTQRLVVGLVRGLHGLRGAVRVEVLTDDRARFGSGSVLFAEGSQRPLTIASSRTEGPGLLVTFRELADRTAVEFLRDTYLEAAVPRTLGEGEYYWHEVVGAEVRTADGEPLGTVQDVFRAGGGEVFTVHGPRGEVLVPAVAGVITEFEPQRGVIVVDRITLGLDEEEAPPRRRRPPGHRRGAGDA